MARYLLDTNHLSPLVTPGHRLRQKVLINSDATNQFHIPALVIAEALYGMGLLPRGKENLAEWDALKTGFVLWEATVQDAEYAARLRINLRRQGKQIEAIDAMIAALALRLDLVLLTSDGDFKFVPNLKQENWL